MSIEDQVLKKISNFKRGKIFFPTDFQSLGSSMAVRQALSRLEDKKVLIRLAHGIYLYPKSHSVLGVLLPTVEDVAVAISKRDKARIIPTGVYALNKLGLSTQVPMKAVYLTDGSPRLLKIGKRTIKFKVATPKILSVKNELDLLVIQAMKEIGEKAIKPEEKEKLRGALAKVSTSDLKHDLKLAPSWIAAFMKESLKERVKNDLNDGLR